MSETKPLPTDLTEQVTAFRRKFGFPVRTVPTRLSDVPTGEVEQRLRLMASEFCEVLRAFDVAMDSAEQAITRAIDEAAANRVHWPVTISDVARELADLDYVVEGARLTFGIPRVPVATEVHRANMDKVPALPLSPVKLDDWEPPKIAELLARELEAAEE